MRVNNLTRKPLAAFARYSYSYIDGGLPSSASVLTPNLYFYGNTQNWKGFTTDIEEYFITQTEYRKAWVSREQFPKFTFPSDDPSLPTGHYAEFISQWFIYDYEIGRWYNVVAENPYVFSQRGLKHTELDLYFSQDLDPIITDRFDEGEPLSPLLVDSFENNVTELNTITPLLIDYLEN